MNQVQAQFHAQALARRARMAARAVPDRPISLKRPSAFGSALVLPMVRPEPAKVEEVSTLPMVAAVPEAPPQYADAHERAYTRHLFGIRQGAPSIPLIIAATARAFGVRQDMMMSACREKRFVRPRQVAMLLARELTGKSLPEIGRRFGGRDHTTVLNAIRKVEKVLAEDAAIAARIEAARADIAANSTVTL